MQRRIAIYGNQAFAFVVAQIYNVKLLSPDDTLITRLKDKWTKRTIQLKQMGQLSAKEFPTFIKPVVSKIFVAGIFQNIDDFKKVTEELQDTEEILVSTIISDIKAEARCYIMDGVVMDIAFYEGSADLQDGEKFTADFIVDNKDQVSRVVVVDKQDYLNKDHPSFSWIMHDFQVPNRGLLYGKVFGRRGCVKKLVYRFLFIYFMA